MGDRDELVRPVEVRARARYRIWLRYADGTEGEVDLSHLAGRGVFAAWSDPSLLAGVRIGPQGPIRWGESIDVCPDVLYLLLTGMSVGDYMSNLRHAAAST